MSARSQSKPQIFNYALDQSAVLVRTWEGVIEHWTAGCERLYGYSSQQAVGQDCKELLKTRFPVPFEDIKQGLVNSGSWNGELEHERRDGVRIVLSAHWVLMGKPGREQAYVVETQIDITAQTRMRNEIHSAHSELKRVSEELQRSNEDLEEFARITSHDLSAPINSTRWLVDIFLKRHAASLDADGLRCMQQIGRSLARMSELVDGVLSHARAGRQQVSSPEACDAGESFVNALETLESEIQSSGATITHGDLPEVSIAPQALTQLFQNLLSNAIKYARLEEPPIIHLTATAQGNVWQFALRDNGIGIDSSFYGRIFEPMQRLAQTHVEGSGIGLATCRKIVRRAGGEIWVESQPGVGSTFFFTLPA